ncbi:MAG TPA: GGDEF domain-containing protein [Gaiellales bacterium]
MGALVASILLALREHRRARGLADELQLARTEATLLERRDDGTGLWNSRFFVEALTREIERSRAYDRPVALALASVDDVAADEIETSMRTLGAAIGGSVRALDVACRVGTTEFGVIMPETDSKSASVASERVLRAIARARTEGGSTPQAAVGIAACPAHAESFEELVERAGSALRSARRAVREEPVKPGTVPVAMAVWDDED